MFEDLVDETDNVPVLVVDAIRLGRFEPEDGSAATPLLGLTGAYRAAGQTDLQEGYAQSLALTPGRLAMVVRACYLLAKEFGGDYMIALAETASELQQAETLTPQGAPDANTI